MKGVQGEDPSVLTQQTDIEQPTALNGNTLTNEEVSSIEREASASAEHCDHTHKSHRAPGLRAAVLGANDGLVSVAALMMGVGAGSSDLTTLRLTGVAGLLAGALSMAAGEYVSVSSQRDAEKADVELEILEQLKGPEAQAAELAELTEIYVARGLPLQLATEVAECLTKNDVIRAHARDELGIDIDDLANPVQASVLSALSFSGGAALPLLTSAFLSDPSARLIAILVSTTVGLILFGAAGAYFGGAPMGRAATRVLIGGLLALGITYGVGKLFDVESTG